METFLGWWFVGSIWFIGWGYKKYRDYQSVFKFQCKLSLDASLRAKDFETSSLVWQGKYEDLVIEIQKRALTPTPTKPQNQVRKAKSYAEIRKANQFATNEADRLAAEREANTGFEE